MLDLKTLQSALEQLEAERGISKEQIIETIEMALAAAYKKEYGQRGQIIRANFNVKTGEIKFFQIKIVLDESMLKPETEEKNQAPAESETEITEEETRKIRFNPERHIMLGEAKKIKKGVKTEEELIFPLETKEDYGRIAAQTAKQVIIQRIREAERNSIFNEFKEKEGEVISGIVQRVEGRNVFLDLGRATGLLTAEEQVRGERYRIGERIKVLLFSVNQSVKGPSFYLSRTHPRLIAKLFEIEVPEVASGTVEIKNIVRETGSRSKIAVISNEEGVDPVGSCVGQKGVRVNTVTAELGGEKIDIIEWSENPEIFIANALSPAKVLNVDADEKKKEAKAIVAENQLSLAIGKGGQNVRLAARLTGWKIDIQSQNGKSIAQATEKGEISGKEIKITDKKIKNKK